MYVSDCVYWSVCVCVGVWECVRVSVFERACACGDILARKCAIPREYADDLRTRKLHLHLRLHVYKIGDKIVCELLSLSAAVAISF